MTYNKKQLELGIKIEMEHVATIAKIKKKGYSSKRAVTMIARDHLREDPNYYKKLLKYVEKKRKRKRG